MQPSATIIYYHNLLISHSAHLPSRNNIRNPETAKTRENKKKQNKNKDLTTPESRVVLETLLFLVFFVFSRFLLLLVKNKKTRENYKNKDLTTSPESSSSGNFVFFCFPEVFATFAEKPKRTRENQKTKDLTTSPE